MITLNFLWHMHQPDYRHPQSGVQIMPWVRLHAVKGYADLLSILERYDHAKCVVNFSGILLEQIACLNRGEEDYYAALSARPAETYSKDERLFILNNFYSLNRHTLIKPHQRYYELFSKREHMLRADGLDEASERFTNQEFTDLVVWFNLAWIGFAGQKRGDVHDLIMRGRDFTHEHQLQVLAIHKEMLAKVLPGYKSLADQERIELSFTPHYHPILPLLIDLAGEGCRNDALPLPHFEHREDAMEHIRRGIDHYTSAFGRTPRGVWPAEGSVSDAALAAFASAGLDWAMTDQQNLPGREHRPLGHTTPWRWERQGSNIGVFFRDTRLADNIGFEYASWNPALAGGHMVDMAAALGRQSGLSNPVVTVALDGENPWEGYQDGGEGFLCALCERIGSDQQLVCKTPSQIIDTMQLPTFEHISSGSWIGGNFNIWSRHPETRIAWGHLATARQELIDVCTGDVLTHLLAAEGSDWFWWYGDDFSSDQLAKFDELFRAHLIAAYELAGRKVPDALFQPIHSEKVAEAIGEPLSLIEPTIDGRETTFFEWRGAVRIKASQSQSSMARSSTADGISMLLYGYSATTLYIRLDLAPEVLAAWQPDNGSVLVCISQDGTEFCLKFGQGQPQPGSGAAYAVDKLIELAIPLAGTPLKRGQPAYLWVELETGSGIKLRFPLGGRIPFSVIAADFSSRNWMI